jgi:hypothetical protein
MKVSLKGLKTMEAPEDRGLLFIDVEYNNTNYDWHLFIPSDRITDISGFIEDSLEFIKDDIDTKESQWDSMDKQRVGLDPFTNEEIVINIDKSEIVKPDFPDYYMKRRTEYPSIGEQLDALWKGEDSPDYISVKNKVLGVKQSNPKPPKAILPPSVEL